MAVVHLEFFSLLPSLSLSVSSITPDQMGCAKYSPTKELQSTAVTFKTTQLPQPHTVLPLSPSHSHLPFVFQCKQCFMGCVLRLDSVEKAVLFLVVLLRAEHALIIKRFNRTAQSSFHFALYCTFSLSWYTGVLLMCIRLRPETYSSKYLSQMH